MTELVVVLQGGWWRGSICWGSKLRGAAEYLGLGLFKYIHMYELCAYRCCT